MMALNLGKHSNLIGAHNPKGAHSGNPTWLIGLDQPRGYPEKKCRNSLIVCQENPSLGLTCLVIPREANSSWLKQGESPAIIGAS
jgi:hypothetical protein